MRLSLKCLWIRCFPLSNKLNNIDLKKKKTASGHVQFEACFLGPQLKCLDNQLIMKQMWPGGEKNGNLDQILMETAFFVLRNIATGE